MCGRQSGILPNHELAKFKSWQRRALLITGLIVLMCIVAVKVYWLQIHWAERYQAYFHEATTNKAVGADLVLGSCKNKSPDHRSAVLDCVQARKMYEVDPDAEARYKAYDHLIEDHLSLFSLIGNCHDGICSSLLWRFADKVLHNYHFTMIVAAVVFSCTVIVALWVYIHCHFALKEKRKVERMARGNPAHQTKAQLFEAIEDLAQVKSAMQVSGNSNFALARPRFVAAQKAFDNAVQADSDVAKGEVALDPDAHFLHHRGQPFRLTDDNYQQRV